jgi:hypothetical protein
VCALCALALLWVAGSVPGSCCAEHARWKRAPERAAFRLSRGDDRNAQRLTHKPKNSDRGGWGRRGIHIQFFATSSI